MKQKILKMPHQQKAMRDIIAAGFPHHNPGHLLIADTGIGKTYIVSSLIQELTNSGWFEDRRKATGSKTPFNVLWLTKAKVVIQTRNVINAYGLNKEGLIITTNYEQLRGKFGKIFIREVERVDNRGNTYTSMRWDETFTPLMIIADECQVFKNPRSIRSVQFQSLLDSFERDNAPKVLHMSATPFTRVSDAKAVVCSLRPTHNVGWQGEVEIDSNHWQYFSERIASPARPQAYVRAAVGRLMDKIEPMITRVKNVRPKFHSKAELRIVPFSNASDAQRYKDAYDKYVKKMIAIRRDDRAQAAGQYLVQLLIFRKEAELIRAPYLAELIVKALKDNKAPVVGVNYKATIRRIVKILINEYDIKRSDMSIIFGGISSPDLANDPSLLCEKSWDLVPKNNNELETIKDDFLADKTRIALFTLASGGTGLSLHNMIEGGRERVGFHSVSYSDIELVQYLGRAHRITSLSDTIQYIVLFKNTIEESHVAPILTNKLKSLGRVIGSTAAWSNCLIDPNELPENDVKQIAAVIEKEEIRANTKALDSENQDLLVEAEIIEESSTSTPTPTPNSVIDKTPEEFNTLESEGVSEESEKELMAVSEWQQYSTLIDTNLVNY